MRSKERLVGMALIAIMVISIFTAIVAIGDEIQSVASVSMTSLPSSGEAIPGQVIIGFKEDMTMSAEQNALIGKYDGAILDRNLALNCVLVEVDASQEFITAISKDIFVKYAEPNYIVKALYTPNDYYYYLQWGPPAIKADLAWDTEKGDYDNVKIAIIDTGIDHSHEDLGNYVAGGYDWVNSDNDPWDDEGHGTHCAGIAAAVMDNEIGVAGIAQVKVMAEKVLNETGFGSVWNVSQGIRHAADNDADVISMSLGDYSYSSTLEDACQYAWNAGCILVGAAGNDNTATIMYPAKYDTVICVGAIDQDDQRCDFPSWGSNWGPEMELVAPGNWTASTYPGNNYAYASGTSMATPHVTGVAALVWSNCPELTNQQVRDRLDNTADDPGTTGWDEYYGYGRVDAEEAIECGVAQPDIWVSPTSFEKELSPDKVHSENLTIGNNGTGALNFEIQIDYMEQQTSSAKATTFNAIEDNNSDSIKEIEAGTDIAFVKWDKNCKLISLPSNKSEDSLSQVIVADDTNYTLRPSKDEAVAGTPGNTKLYLRYISSSKPMVLRESKGSSVYFWILKKPGATAKWDDYYLTGDISGDKYDFKLWASSDSSTDFIATIKVEGTPIVPLVYFTCDYPCVYPTFCRFTGTVTGIDPETFNGDEVTLEITFNGPDTGYIAYGGGSYPSADWYSYITIPPPTTEKIHDMAVTKIYTTPSSPTVGQATTIYVTVKNEGNQAESNVPVKAYIDGSQVDSTKFVSLSAGQSTTKSFSWTPSTAKTYSVKGEVGVVSGETDTADNSKTISVIVTPLPEHDMAVTNVYTTPSSPTVGQATTINVTVKNEGNQAESNVPVKAYVDGSQVDSTKYVSLSAGQSTTESFPWTPGTAKTYSVKGEVGVVSGETDTVDNTKIIDVYASPKGWLSVSPTSGTVNLGSQTNINVIFNTTDLSIGDYYANINITSNDPDESVVTVPVHLTVRPKPVIFDTEQPKNPYPSIFGTHNGAITPNVTIYNVSRLYTYSCAGTGGHSASAAFFNATTGAEIANGTWNGYQGAGDYHYIELNVPFDLQATVTYNYTIRTGSYPQIHHTDALPTANGWINCTKFTDANGKEYTDWIPAIRLE
jgi:thermitase